MGPFVNTGLTKGVLELAVEHDIGVGQPVFMGQFEPIVNGSHPIAKPVGELDNRRADVTAADHDKMGLGHENLQVNRY